MKRADELDERLIAQSPTAELLTLSAGQPVAARPLEAEPQS